MSIINLIYNSPNGGGGGWQPGANTLVYYDFEHTSGTGETNLAITGSTYNGVYKQAPTIGTLTSGKKYYNSAASGNRTFLYTANKLSTLNYNNATLCLWFAPTNTVNIFGQSWWDTKITNGELYNNEYYFCFGKGDDNLFQGNWTGGTSWHNLVLVNDGTYAKYYLDGSLKNSKSLTSTTGNLYFYLGTTPTASETPSNVPIRGNGASFGAFILENNKARTVTEISDYYNQTKSLYGIS